MDNSSRNMDICQIIAPLQGTGTFSYETVVQPVFLQEGFFLSIGGCNATNTN